MDRYNVATIRERDGAFIYFDDHEQECQILENEIYRLRKALEEIAYGEIETEINNKILRYSQVENMRGLRDIATEALEDT